MSRETVYELSQGAFGVAWPLFADAAYDRVHAAAVFEGTQQGRIFVDDPTAPSSAMLCRTYEYFLAGLRSQALEQFIEDAPEEADLFDTIHDLDAAKHQPTIAFYGLVPLSDDWREAMPTLYAGNLEVIGRRTFRFELAQHELALSWRVRVPAGFSVHALDATLARRIDDEAGELIGLFWGGYDGFGKHGFGSYAICGVEIAGVCYAIAVSSTEANFGVETVARFRRQGLATVLSQACVEQAISRSLTPTWDCDLPNVASGELARKVGFTEFPSFTEYAFPARGGPDRSIGRWRAEPNQTGTAWVRIDR